MNKIKRIVAKANVTITFFTHLQIFIIRDDKSVMKITNSKEIYVLVKIVRIIYIDFMLSYLWMWSMSWKIVNIFQIGRRRLKICCKKLLKEL